MPPSKRKAAVAKAEPPAKRSARGKTEPPAPAPAKGKAAAKAKAEPAAKAKAEPKGKKGAVDPEEFVSKLLEVCKVLMTVCETIVEEDVAKGTVTEESNFSTYGGDLLNMLPEDARLPMMKIALM